MENRIMTKAVRWFWVINVYLAVLLASQSARSLDLPPTGISYRIEARLDPTTRGLKGTEEIRWTNQTDQPITALPVHLYLNGFSHTRTTWMEEVSRARLRLEDLLAREPDPWGYTELVEVEQHIGEQRVAAKWEVSRPDDGNALDRSLVEVTLASAVEPGEEIVLKITFEARLPIPIARTGGQRDYFLIAQWYPKIGVIEPSGVRYAVKPRNAARQFHGATEFYADFADYDVTFSLPDGWLVGATGKIEGEPVADGSGSVAFHYKQRAVHDFALVAGTHLKDQWISHTPEGGGPTVDVRYIVPAGTEHQIPRWQRAIEGSLDVLGSRVGPYPYQTLTVVLVPYWAIRTAGMEYPTLITGAFGDPILDHPLTLGLKDAESTAIHEFGHQYFYGILASNEQEEAFLDEGFNSYWEYQIMNSLYGRPASRFLGRDIDELQMRALNLDSVAANIHEPMRKIPSWLFASDTLRQQIYSRSVVTFATAASLFGQDKVDATFAEYFGRFAFKHPDADDFLDVARDAGGAEFMAFCKEAFEREEIPDFAVTEVVTGAWKAPLGRVLTDKGPVVIEESHRREYRDVTLPVEAREEDGHILMEVTDAGWARAGQIQPGFIKRMLVMPETPPDREGYRSTGYYESTVRIVGPGWDTLPVDLEFRFVDGAVVRDRWDGKAAWREYRFIRPAAIKDARVDAAGHIAVDVKPQNNALSASADKGFATDWGLWFFALAQWLTSGLSLWL